MNLPVLPTPSPVAESAALPPLYADWVRALLPGPVPAETVATCDDCAMCDAHAAPHGSAEWYNPATKCCTYLPQIPNFNVGRILLDDDPAMVRGRRTAEARIAGPMATPLGVRIPPAYTTLYDAYRHRFGHAEEMRCPHYLPDSGQCGIWRHRNAICSTWFCKHLRGAVGHSFWRVLRQLLTAVEYQLEFWCVEQLAPGDDAVLALMSLRRDPTVRQPPATDDGPPTLAKGSPAYDVAWGRWAGKEREFYRRCAGLVAGLTWDDVVAIGGQEVRLLAAATRTAYRALCSTAVPDALRPGVFTVGQAGPDSVRVSAYSTSDDVVLPRELFDALARFDGRPTAAAVRAVEDDLGLRLTPDLVRGLVDFGILT